jgi:hypothetical protein
VIGVVVAAALVAGGCGQAGRSSTDTAGPATTATATAPPTEAPSTVASTATTKPPNGATTHTVRPSSTTSTSRHAVSVLQQRSLRSSGVDALLSAFIGGAGGDSCLTSGLTDADFPGPAIAVNLFNDPAKASTTEVFIGEPLDICFYRFRAGRPLLVTVTSPTGTTQRYTVCYDCAKSRPTSLLWYTLAGQPRGQYHVVATQGTASARATVTVTPERFATIYVAGHDPAEFITAEPRGTVVRISFTGYAPSRRVWVLLYRNPDPNSGGIGASYRTRLSLQMSARGEALLTIPTSNADPVGCYVINTIPPAFTPVTVDRGNGFCIA